MFVIIWRVLCRLELTVLPILKCFSRVPFRLPFTNRAVLDSTARANYRLVSTVEPLVSDHPKCQALIGGRLREVVDYESLNHIGSKFYLIRIW